MVCVSDLRMADEGQVDCQRWMDGGGRGLLDGEVSVGRGAGEGQHLLRDLERAGRQRGRIIEARRDRMVRHVGRMVV